MLEPDSRSLFVDALRPPEGYRFDCGIGTTFSLDLMSLLVVPLALALDDLPDARHALAEPLLLLESLCRYADRLTVFCQTGRISVPPPDNCLLSMLEGMVVEVAPSRRGGVFHPKVWLLRYAPLGDVAPVLYRCLNASRNLTFDRSWDLMLRLEGAFDATRRYAFGRNHPLGDFVQALPRLARHRVSRRISDQVDMLQDEVRRVRFSVPDGFDSDEWAFVPMGLGRASHDPLPSMYDRALVLSPFVTDSVIDRIGCVGRRNVLISRPDWMAMLQPETCARYDELLTLSADSVADADEQMPSDVGAEEPGGRSDSAGLHAKLFVHESGRRATWLQGSVNATSAALHSNIKFAVRLEGARRSVGIDCILGDDSSAGTLRSMLAPYVLAEGVNVETDSPDAQRLAETVQAWLAHLELRLDAAPVDRELYALDLSWSGGDPPEGVYEIQCRLATQRPEYGVRFPEQGGAGHLVFPDLSVLGMTSFVAFKVRAQHETEESSLSFVRNVPITGAPEGRFDHVFQSVISDRQGFLRYLWLLLTLEQGELPDGAMADGLGNLAWWPTAGADADLPLFESLVRALSRAPGSIDRIAELVERLNRTEQGGDCIPDGFASLWHMICEARRGIE